MVNKFGIVQGKAGRPSTRPPFEEFEKVAKGNNISEIARHFSVSRNTIYKWIKEFEQERN